MSARWRRAERPSQSAVAYAARGTATCAARGPSTDTGTVSRRSGKRPSYCKAFSRTAKASRVAPVFSPSRRHSSSESVQCWVSSSGCQACFIAGAPLLGVWSTTRKSKRTTSHKDETAKSSRHSRTKEGATMAKNPSTVCSQTTKASSPQDMTEVLRETTKLWRKHHLSYDQRRYVVAQARRTLQLSAPRERRRTV